MTKQNLRDQVAFLRKIQRTQQRGAPPSLASNASDRLFLCELKDRPCLIFGPCSSHSRRLPRTEASGCDVVCDLDTLDGILAEHLPHMHTLRDINLAVYAAAKKKNSKPWSRPQPGSTSGEACTVMANKMTTERRNISQI
jgi:hypothetical protein